MNKRYFKYIAFVTAIGLSSCSSDYLETTPTDKLDPSVVFETTESAKLAVNGIAKLMTTQHLGSQGFNGEGTIKLWYGDQQGTGISFPKGAWAYQQITMMFNSDNTSGYNYYPWYYYYSLISNANTILENIDAASGSDSDKFMIKAQALTYRAYSFFMLSQIYGNRWVDSNNGATSGVVLKLNSVDKNTPLSTLGETYNQVYKDLELAISYFGESSWVRKRADFYVLNVDVAHGILARAAITKGDYPTAEKHAALARKDGTDQYPLMNNSEYDQGFSLPQNEWIWGSYGSEDQTLYFYSYFAYMAYNSTSSQIRTYPRRISKELFNQIPATDMRRDLFLDPEDFKYDKATGAADVADGQLINKAFAMRPNIAPTATIHAYMQLKISNIAQAGVGNLVHLRAAEMYLLEAEAAYFNSNEAKARQLLEAVVKPRDPNFTTTLSGSALFEQIKFYRAVELWGEGFNWFDLKRWNDPIVRHSDKDGGNFHIDYQGTILPSEKNKWTYVIPSLETDYNESM